MSIYNHIRVTTKRWWRPGFVSYMSPARQRGNARHFCSRPRPFSSRLVVRAYSLSLGLIVDWLHTGTGNQPSAELRENALVVYYPLFGRRQNKFATYQTTNIGRTHAESASCEKDAVGGKYLLLSPKRSWQASVISASASTVTEAVLRATEGKRGGGGRQMRV